MEKVSFVQKVLAKLNLNEEGKIGLAVDAITKFYEKEVKSYERKISDTNATAAEKLVDMEEVLSELKIEKTEIIATIDVESIKTNEDRKAYISVYTRKARAAINAVKAQEERIKEYKEDVEEAVAEYTEQIDLLKELLAEMA